MYKKSESSFFVGLQTFAAIKVNYKIIQQKTTKNALTI